MSKTTLSRNELLDEAADIVRGYEPDAPIGSAFADWLIGAIHEQFPHLVTLANRRSYSAQVDQNRWMEENPGVDLFEWVMQDESADSEATRLAGKAYEAALRAAIFQHRS